MHLWLSATCTHWYRSEPEIMSPLRWRHISFWVCMLVLWLSGSIPKGFHIKKHPWVPSLSRRVLPRSAVHVCVIMLTSLYGLVQNSSELYLNSIFRHHAEGMLRSTFWPSCVWPSIENAIPEFIEINAKITNSSIWLIMDYLTPIICVRCNFVLIGVLHN